MMNADFTFEITEKFGVIAAGSKGWNLELNKVSWSGKAPKYDIRQWDPEHSKMGKGVTFTAEELISLKNLLNSIEIN